MRICWGSQYGWCCLAEPQSFSVFFTLFTRGQEKIAFALPFRDGPKHSSSQWGILESLWDNFLECFCYKRNRSRWPLYSCLELECDSATTADTYQPWGGKQMGNQENPRDRGAWWAAVSVVAQSRTWLKRLSSSSRLYISHCGCKDVWLLCPM